MSYLTDTEASDLLKALAQAGEDRKAVATVLWEEAPIPVVLNGQELQEWALDVGLVAGQATSPEDCLARYRQLLVDSFGEPPEDED